MSPAKVLSLLNKRERRLSVLAKRTPSRSRARREAKEAALSPIRKIITDLKLETLRGDYQILGRVESMTTPAGKMVFGDAGPVIAHLKRSSSLAFLTPWPGLDPIQVPTDEPCPACLNECEVCEGKKKILCKHKGCGGAGVLKHDPTPCPKCQGGPKQKTNPKCGECGGSGNVFEQKKCPECKGRKKQKCDGCNGAGQRGTGKREGSNDYHAPRCSECNGHGKKIELVEQSMESFCIADSPVYLVGGGKVDYRKEGMRAVGPISRMLVREMEGGYVNGFAVIETSADCDPLLLLIDERAVEMPMYLTGGRPKLRILNTA
ncbi:MAG TPA: hypothetical protein VH024_00260 [Candidatus Angelobacter sp.]|jgi:hypothetical protein|nr:hypothetical protein [Candidatus Angelobacter sp.]